MSQSSPWKWLLARCNTWLAAVSGDSWKAGYTKWSQSSICPSSSRTIFSWISEDTFTKSPIWVWIFVPNIDGEKSPTMWINTQIFFRLRAAIHKIFRRQTQSRFLSCFDPCLSAETRLMLHHKRALQTRIIKLCSGAAAILVYIFFTFLITFSFFFLLLLHFNLKRTTCFKLYT